MPRFRCRSMLCPIILSRRFSFVSPLWRLYSPVVIPLHAFVSTFVRMAFAIWSQHYNRGTNCPPLGFQFWVTSKHLLYVITRIYRICQHLHYIRYREIVLLLFCIPHDANFLALKELYSEILVHDDTILCELVAKLQNILQRGSDMTDFNTI